MKSINDASLVLLFGSILLMKNVSSGFIIPRISNTKVLMAPPVSSLHPKVLFMTTNTTGNNMNEMPPPTSLKHPVLVKVYPNLIQNIEKFGHPNIPLGSAEGRACNTLRRLVIQNKLSEEEVDFLKSINFVFTFEDIYSVSNFDEMLERLVKYKESSEGGDYQIAKKYKNDPELGAWVAAIRRLGPEGLIIKDHQAALNNIQFEWVSTTRKCGSKFMKSYRELKEKFITQASKGRFTQIEQFDECMTFLNGTDHTSNNYQSIWGRIFSADHEAKKWLISQRKSFENGKLSEARQAYLDQLPDIEWRDFCNE